MSMQTTETSERYHRSKLVKGYSQMIREHIKLGKEASFVNFMFNQIPGGIERQKGVMTREVRRVHDILARNIVRKPSSAACKHLRPAFVGCHDFPVMKHEKQCVSTFTVNGGMHFNAIVLVPPPVIWTWDRGAEKLPRAGWNTSLEEHFHMKARFYVNSTLYRIHVTPVEEGTMADYALKAFKSWRVSSDDILVL